MSGNKMSTRDECPLIMEVKAEPVEVEDNVTMQKLHSVSDNDEHCADEEMCKDYKYEDVKVNEVVHIIKEEEVAEFIGGPLDQNMIKTEETAVDDKTCSSAKCSDVCEGLSDVQLHDVTEGEGKQYSCPECSKSFTRASSYKRHSRLHTSDFSCSVCSKPFVRGSHLKEHMRIHTGEKPFSCPFCSKRFAQASFVKKHIRIHTGEKPYSCPVCAKSFTWVGDLKGHTLIHSGERPHTCTLCSKAFKQASSLKKHMMTHTGEKPHHCSQCSKSFTRAISLKNHLRRHIGEKSHFYLHWSKNHHHS